ncbi:hypothetical protein [Cellvibrio japonicus]|uniref:Uncharacterized protein n=1 Tax=Cellvibrio japonicus (strain Ueda107) TaxID=498211 RepID=B3PJ88_CELJU|nr:hypothetical protein [Cellvibrio japonicus]ACE85709.1 hypothetical protein CJA_2200 [Cellvibrio japonicus Ueda107]QEI12642.1 hypothetical protein FY117_10675 [Cellvibrio japonicus]QEI16216.1 hypothetical protein FY116_10680 [Cellvibrio japonicus]QEI19794.1 hypothetical protein FY115_10675 [Cellvibrio japonicus]
MNFDDWTADAATGTATHTSGFSLRIEGNPRDPSEVYPGKFPEGMSFVNQARLLRAGLEFLAKTSRDNNSYIIPKPELKSAAAREREALAKQFAERPDKPQRSVLSLKKSSS